MTRGRLTWLPALFAFCPDLLAHCLLYCQLALPVILNIALYRQVKVIQRDSYVILSLKAKYERLIVDMRNEIEREREKSSAERHSLASQLEQATRESKDFSALLRERDEVMLFLNTVVAVRHYNKD